MSQLLAERVEFFTGEQKGLYLAVIGGAGALISTLIQLAIGPISDNTGHRWGRRFIFIASGILLNTVPIFLFALSQSFFQLLAAFVLIQFFLNIATGPFQAVIPDLVPPEHHGKASGWMGLWQLLGQVFGLILPGVLLSPFLVNRLTGQNLSDASATSLGVLLTCTICAAVLLTCLAMSAKVLIQPPLKHVQVLPLWTVANHVFDLQLRAYPDFTRLLISRFVINIGIYGAIEFLRYYVQEALGPDDVSLTTMYLALMATLGGVVGTLAAGRLADKLSKRKLIYWACGLAAAAAIGFCLTSNLTVALFAGLIFGVGYGAFSAVDWAFATNLMPRGREGKYMAIFHIAFTIPQVLSLTLGGLIGHWLGYRTVFWMVPFYLLAGTLILSKVRERHEIEAQQKL